MRGTPPGLNTLSSREQEVLALTARGFSSREIGKKLFISPKTVDTYRARITEKTGSDAPIRIGAVRPTGGDFSRSCS